MTARILVALAVVAVVFVAGYLYRGQAAGAGAGTKPRIVASHTEADDWLPVDAPWRSVTASPAGPRPAQSGAPSSHRRAWLAGAGTVQGTASWYWNGPGLYAAAGPALRVGAWRGRLVTVCAAAKSGVVSRCLHVRLTDACQCYGTRLLDLSRDAFARLAPLSVGLVRVRVSW